MKKAQIELQFNWIFILIAGAAILFFFFTLISQQRTVSEERLQRDVTRIIENIFVGAGVSEKTKNLITIPPQYEFSFTCDDEKDIRRFGITNSDAYVELPQEPIFAPATLQGTRLITWSLPVQLPYKVADILMVTAPTIKYVVIAEEGDPFARELEKDVRPSPPPDGQNQPVRIQEGLNFDEFLTLEQFQQEHFEIGNNNHLRFVFLNDQPQFSQSLRGVPDDQVSAVALTGGSVTYFRKQGDRFTSLGPPVPIPYVGSGKQSLRIAALFAEDTVAFQCNLKKVIKQMKLVTELYQKKIIDLDAYYTDIQPNENCALKTKTIKDEQLRSLATTADICVHQWSEDCIETLQNKAQQLSEHTNNPQTGLSKICPITLY